MNSRSYGLLTKIDNTLSIVMKTLVLLVFLLIPVIGDGMLAMVIFAILEDKLFIKDGVKRNLPTIELLLFYLIFVASFAIRMLIFISLS